MTTGTLFRLMVLCGLVLHSCVNQISDEEPITSGEIPISLFTHASGSTELPQQGFREGDSIGLYGLIQPHTLSDARYLENIKLICDASLNFIPEKEIFFPDGDDKCELIGYFPYREGAIESGQSLLEVSVLSDQHREESFVSSDFRTARTGYQKFDGSQIKFTFQHTGCLLKVKIVNGSENSTDLLSGGDIEASLYGFYRQALYDLDKNEFSDWQQPEAISLFGEWTATEVGQQQQISGKQAILIPQPFRKDDQYLSLRIDQKTHICPFPESLKLESGKICVLTIHYKPEDREIGNVTCNTEEWTEGSSGSSDTQELRHPIYADELPFDQSGICRIWWQGHPIAEVCKEYLRTEQVEATAVVLYPMTEGKSDLTKGQVLHLYGVSQPIHGGIVNWDLSSNQCTYTPGNRLPIPYFFIDYDGSIVLSSPKDAQQVVVESLFLTDSRSDESLTYPVVKIGTQYWMQSDLKATRYVDGVQIPKKATPSTPEEGYMASGTDYFYNDKAIKTGKLSPDGWKVPGTKEWKLLLEYLDWDASLMKTGHWEDRIYPATNQTGFGGRAVGLFLPAYSFRNQVVGYWSVGESEAEIPEFSYFLMHDNRKVQEGLNRSDKALSIRCIRE